MFSLYHSQRNRQNRATRSKNSYMILAMEAQTMAVLQTQRSFQKTETRCLALCTPHDHLIYVIDSDLSGANAFLAWACKIRPENASSQHAVGADHG